VTIATLPHPPGRSSARHVHARSAPRLCSWFYPWSDPDALYVITFDYRGTSFSDSATSLVPIAQGREVYDAAGSIDKSFVAVPGKDHVTGIWSMEADNAIAAFVAMQSSPSPPVEP
jgi:hypothetical protein